MNFKLLTDFNFSSHRWFLVSVFLIIFLFIGQEVSNYQKAIEQVSKETNNLSTLLIKKIEHDFERVDNILLLTKKAIFTKDKNSVFYDNRILEEYNDTISIKLKSFADSFDEIEKLIYIDKDGDIKYASNRLSKDVNVSDREYFKELKNNKDLNKSFSDVVISRLSGRESILLLHAIRDENKNLDGILAAVINTSFIRKILSSIDIGQNGVALIRNSETTKLITRYPSLDDSLINKPLPKDNEISKLIKSGSKYGYLEYTASTDDIKRFASFITMENFPFYIQIALSQDEYLKSWKDNLIVKSIFLGLFIFASIIIISVMKRNFNNEQKLLKELNNEKDRFENMFRIHSSIMLLIDPKDGQILDANNSAVSFYGYSLEKLKSMNVNEINQLSQEELNTIYQEAKQLKTNSFVFEHKLNNGKIKIVEVDSSPIETTSGIILFSIIKDVTKEKKIEDRLKRSYKRIEKLIDLQDNMIILTNGKNTKYANNKFFDFFGFSNLSDFKKSHKSICEFFIQNDEFFHLKKLENPENWINELKILDGSKRIVAMKGKNSKEHKFFVTVNSFDEDIMIIGFTDITNTIKEKIKLEIKVTQDKLTNAYNREYFDKYYKDWIISINKFNLKLAVVMLDIDNFKYVNDTFGHDVGDLVLIDFVKVICTNLRSNDIFVRWGGEEFILVLKLKDEKDLLKILENLRHKVEIYNFPKIGKRTCSFGATIYKDDEDIFKTIKRADEAVYKAKNLGRNRVEIIS